jgi:RHS repeat-associated protein
VRSGVEVSQKRYRYTGKERDEESGLYYHGARYYAPWLGRWMSCDPLGLKDQINLFAFTRNNPIKLRDRDGQATDPEDPDLIAGQYRVVKGHHVVQVAAYIPKRGKRSEDPLYRSALSISQREGDFTPRRHDAVSRAQTLINSAIWSSVTWRIDRRSGRTWQEGDPPSPSDGRRKAGAHLVATDSVSV